MEDGKARIIVDTRENGFPRLLSDLGAEVEIKMLEVGDFVCSEFTVIERKTRQDFEASVLDRRLFSQLPNLKANYPNVIIIVEGERQDGGPLSRAALMGAYASIMTDFCASIFFTKNEKATSELIFAIAKHEQLGKKVSGPVFAKRKTLTISQTSRSVIETLPMVGPLMAKKLLMHFGSVQEIFNASEEKLMEVEGLGEKKAKAIFRTIRAPYNPDED